MHICADLIRSTLICAKQIGKNGPTYLSLAINMLGGVFPQPNSNFLIMNDNLKQCDIHQTGYQMVI